MTTREWYKTHEGWLGALMLSIGAFSIGILVATFLGRAACTGQISALVSGYNILLSQKDQVITKLSNSTATASSAVSQLESVNAAQDKQMNSNKSDIESLKQQVKAIKDAGKH